MWSIYTSSGCAWSAFCMQQISPVPGHASAVAFSSVPQKLAEVSNMHATMSAVFNAYDALLPNSSCSKQQHIQNPILCTHALCTPPRVASLLTYCSPRPLRNSSNTIAACLLLAKDTHPAAADPLSYILPLLLLLPACHPQAIMLTWCYLAAVLVDPGQVPLGWHPFPDDAVSGPAAA
jgi:hypothetical protein